MDCIRCALRCCAPRPNVGCGSGAHRRSSDRRTNDSRQEEAIKTYGFPSGEEVLIAVGLLQATSLTTRIASSLNTVVVAVH